MQREQKILGLIDAGGKERGAAEVGVHALHQAAMGLADVRSARSRFKTKDLVGLLLGHGARAWRASLPATNVRLSVFAPGGKTAVKIRLQ